MSKKQGTKYGQKVIAIAALVGGAGISAVQAMRKRKEKKGKK